MSRIKIEHPSKEMLSQLGTEEWSPWECEPSQFDWEYDCDETAYVLDGHVTVKTAEETVEIKKGDLVTFPRGLKCTWTVHQKIRKVFTFDDY